MKQYRENAKRGTENFPFAYYKESYTNHMIRLHWHPEIELLYGIKGELAVTVAEEQHILKAGEILFINHLSHTSQNLCKKGIVQLRYDHTDGVSLSSGEILCRS